MNLVERRGLWFFISLVLILPGILYMIWHMATMGTPLPLAIDYTGGTQWEMNFERPIVLNEVRQVFMDAGYPDTTAFLVSVDQSTVRVNLNTFDADQKDAMIRDITDRFGPFALTVEDAAETQWLMRFERSVDPTEVVNVFVTAGYPETTALLIEEAPRTVQLKLKTIDQDQKDTLGAEVTARLGPFKDRSFRSIGPTIGAEVSRAALLAVIAASALILIYIAAAFREVPHPFRFGTAAIIALTHDVFVTISFVAIMNLVAGWEVDALFLTAVLTVIGFSVNDTIVIFDRIRENLHRHRGESFATVTNRSLIETMQRSISTQVTAMLILVALIIFGGATLRVFMSTLLVGLISGTYSSIFNAAPMVVAWEERSLLGKSVPEKINGLVVSA